MTTHTMSVDSGNGNQLAAGLDVLSRSDAGLDAVIDLAASHGEVWVYIDSGDSVRVSSRMLRRTVRRLLSSLEG